MMRPLRVLLIDNDPAEAARLGEVLMGLGNLELTSSATLAEAIAKLTSPNEEGFDVLLLDLLAGGMEDLIELNQAKERFDAAFTFAPIGMALTTAAGDFLYINRSLHEMLGHAPEAMTGMNLVELTHRDDASTAQRFVEQLAAGELQRFQGETRYLKADGETMLAALTVSTIKDSVGEPFQFVVQIEDVTARRTNEDQLTHQVLHDTLTGLPNRILLFDRL